ncbi:MAG: hypothetical protein J07HQX50_02820, partial [Haloquadratum sp. J07HQX50]
IMKHCLCEITRGLRILEKIMIMTAIARVKANQPETTPTTCIFGSVFARLAHE